MPSPQVADRLKDYVPVNERLEQFWSEYPEGKILTSVLEHSAEDGFILMRAEIYRNPDDAQPAATGHAFENRSEGYVNKTSYIENCETSCVGRGLALLGYEIKRGIASREEMEKVDRMSTSPIKAVPSERDTLMEGIQNACKLLNQSGEDPPFTPARLREFVKAEFDIATVEELGLNEVRELLKKLSLRLDALNNERRGPLQNMPTVPRCECGERKRVEGVTKTGKNKGKKWAAWMCPDKVEGHEPIWIDLDAEAEALAISDGNGTEEYPF